MTKIFTLRNIIALSVPLFFAGCSNNDEYQNSNTISGVKTISSSEDNKEDLAYVGVVQDNITGETKYIVAKK